MDAQITLVDAVAVMRVAQRDQVFGIVRAVLGEKNDVVDFQLPARRTARCLATPFVAIENPPVVGATRGIYALPFIYGALHEKKRSSPRGKRTVVRLNTRDGGVPMGDERFRGPKRADANIR